jgi:hypothetical protein
MATSWSESCAEAGDALVSQIAARAATRTFLRMGVI